MDEDELKLLKEHLLNAVFHKEEKRLVKELGAIQDKHAIRYGCRAFLLDGKPVWNGDAAAAKQKAKKPIDADLLPDARHLVSRIHKLGIDKQRVINFFGILIQRCHSLEDFRDMLPDVVVERMEGHEITGIPRTREPGYALTSSPSKSKLYQDGLDIMFAYLVNELVF